MNWEAIGAIGEVLGAAAVVATLAYLAVQVRFAKKAAADSSRLNRASGVNQMLLALSTDDGLRNATIRANGTTEYYQEYADKFGIDIDEAGRCDHNASYWFWLHWGQFASSTNQRDLEELEHLIANVYTVPYIRHSWETSNNARPILDKEFVGFVDRILAAEDARV